MSEINRLNVKNFGLALGFSMGIYVLIQGIAAWWFDRGTAVVHLLSSLYIGYAPTPLGCLIGGIWGFTDGFVGGVLIAWFYNKFQK